MPAYCIYPNCFNTKNKGVRLFRFPRNAERNKEWTLFCGKDASKMNYSFYLCQIHFPSDSLLENGSLKTTAKPSIRLLGKRKVRSPANRNGMRKRNKPNVVYEPTLMPVTVYEPRTDTIPSLQEEVKNLKITIEKLTAHLNTFFNIDQLQFLEGKRVSEWSTETLQTSLRHLYNLGKTGYEYMRQNGYPFPSIATLHKRIAHVNSKQ